MSWVVWALLSALFAAATAVLAKFGVQHINSNLATAIRTTIVFAFAWALVFALKEHHVIPTIEKRSWIMLAASGLCTGASWLCYFRALQLGPISGVAPIDKLSVALVILCGWLFLGESMTLARALGGSLITVGALVLALA